MHSLEDIRWRNASYEGVVSLRVDVTTLTKRRDVDAAQLERLATAIKDALSELGSMVRIEHVRYPG